MPGASTIQRRRALGTMLVLAALSTATAAVATGPRDKAAVIITRLFSYDYNLKARAGDAIVLAVVYKSGVPASEVSADDWVRAFTPLTSVRVADLPFRTVKLAFTDPGALAAAVRGQGIDALLICEGLQGDLSALETVSRSAKIMTVTDQETFVTRGLTVGVYPLEGKTAIAVNRRAAAAENVSFSSELLRLAHTVE
jgi:hypothetical protein